MKSQQIEYTSDGSAITIRIPKGLSEGRPVESDHNACLRERLTLGKILHEVHRSK